MNSKAVALTARVVPLEDRRHRRWHHRTFVQQSEHAGPGWHIEHREHVESVARAPRGARVTLPHELAPQGVESALDLGIDRLESRQGHDEVRSHEHAHVLMQYGPAHFEGHHEIVIDKKSVGHRRAVVGRRGRILRLSVRPARGQCSRPRLQMPAAASDASWAVKALD